MLRALVQGSAQRLEPIVSALGTVPCLPGWQVRIVDGNHLPASEKRLPPGHSPVATTPTSTG